MLSSTSGQRTSSIVSDIRIADYVDDEGVITSHLNLTSISSEDGGIFSCEAINEVSRIKHSATIQVYGPPVVLPMANVSVTSSGKLLLDCPVSGFPIQEIRWKKGKKLMREQKEQKANDISSNLFFIGSRPYFTVVFQVKREREKTMSLCLHAFSFSLKTWAVKEKSERERDVKKETRKDEDQVFNDLSHLQFFIFHVNVFLPDCSLFLSPDHRFLFVSFWRRDRPSSLPTSQVICEWNSDGDWRSHRGWGMV